MTNQIFFEDFENEKDIQEEFKINLLPTVHILFAYYSHENYEGQAFVLFEENGKLYEVNGYHCSCNGLEGQWEPEETTKQSIFHRCEKGRSLEKYSKEIIDILDLF